MLVLFYLTVERNQFKQIRLEHTSLKKTLEISKEFF